MDDRLREVYAVAYPRLVGQLVGVTGDPAEAEDVVMEAFATAYVKPNGDLVTCGRGQDRTWHDDVLPGNESSEE